MIHHRRFALVVGIGGAALSLIVAEHHPAVADPVDAEPRSFAPVEVAPDDNASSPECAPEEPSPESTTTTTPESTTTTPESTTTTPESTTTMPESTTTVEPCPPDVTTPESTTTTVLAPPSTATPDRPTDSQPPDDAPPTASPTTAPAAAPKDDARGGGSTPTPTAEDQPADADTSDPTVTTTTAPVFERVEPSPGSDGPGDGSGSTSQPTAGDDFDGPSEPDRPPLVGASQYDGAQIDGVRVGVAMAALRSLASGGDYDAPPAGSTASGAYGVNDATWDGYQGHPRAVDAPPSVQDQFAYERIVSILREHGADAATIPVVWHNVAALDEPKLRDTVKVTVDGTKVALRKYQHMWLETFDELAAAGAPVMLPEDSEPLVPAIAFPVLGPVDFVDDWHFPRSGGRVHEGLDFIGSYGQPLRAAFDGEVARIVSVDSGISGASIEIRRDDDLRAVYRHVNNDTPGTTDDSAIAAFRIHPGVEQGTRVRAGQIIAYMGDTGNARGLAHLHFELRNAAGIPGDRTPFAPYRAVIEAQEREQCTVGLGPWSTVYESPQEAATAFELLAELGPSELAALEAAELADLDAEQLDRLALSNAQRLAVDNHLPPVPFLVDGDDGARWTVSAIGTVGANGQGAMIPPTDGDCPAAIEANTWYGSEAEGMPIDDLPDEWWGDETPDDAAVDDENVQDAVDMFVAISPVLG